MMGELRINNEAERGQVVYSLDFSVVLGKRIDRL